MSRYHTLSAVSTCALLCPHHPVSARQIRHTILDKISHSSFIVQKLFAVLFAYKKAYVDVGMDTPLLNKLFFRKVRITAYYGCDTCRDPMAFTAVSDSHTPCGHLHHSHIHLLTPPPIPLHIYLLTPPPIPLHIHLLTTVSNGALSPQWCCVRSSEASWEAECAP